jgi:hypothetical protein
VLYGSNCRASAAVRAALSLQSEGKLMRIQWPSNLKPAKCQSKSPACILAALQALRSSWECDIGTSSAVVRILPKFALFQAQTQEVSCHQSLGPRVSPEEPLIWIPSNEMRGSMFFVKGEFLHPFSTAGPHQDLSISVYRKILFSNSGQAN